MLIKKELASVPVLPMPEGDWSKGSWRPTYIPTAQIVELEKSGRILAVDYYEGLNQKLYSRFFCDGSNYIVYNVEKKVWRSGYPYPGCSGYYSGAVASIDRANDVCRKFFQADNKWCRGIEEVNHFIYQKGAAKRDAARENLNALMEKHMQMFPEYPENFKEYCSEHVFQNNYIFFGKKDRKGIRTAWCSHCGSKITIDQAVASGKETTCPVCHKLSMYKATWLTKELSEKADICISYKVDNQLLIRWAHVKRWYGQPSFKEKYSAEDYAFSLYLVVKGAPKLYTYKYFKSPYGYGAEWHRLPIGSDCDDKSYVYTDNLDEVFGTSYYNVNLKAGIEGRNIQIQFVHLLNELKNSPKAEYLFKLGLPALASSASCIDGDPDGQGMFQRQIGVSKQYLPMLRDMNVTPMELHVIKNAHEWVSPELLRRYRNFSLRNYTMTLSDLIEDVGISRALNYLDKQRKLHPRERTNKLLVEYRDYLRMSKELRVDLSHKSVLFPSDVIEAHKTITARYNAVLQEIKMIEGERLNSEFHKRVNEHYSRIGLSGFQKDGYCIVLPQLRTDLIKEGQSLNHCVGEDGYYRSCMMGVNMIFFVRKADDPEKPFFTMEMDVTDGRIKQLYGFGDCSAPKEVRAFADAFSRHVCGKTRRKTA